MTSTRGLAVSISSPCRPCRSLWSRRSSDAGWRPSPPARWFLWTACLQTGRWTATSASPSAGGQRDERKTEQDNQFHTYISRKLRCFFRETSAQFILFVSWCMMLVRWEDEYRCWGQPCPSPFILMPISRDQEFDVFVRQQVNSTRFLKNSRSELQWLHNLRKQALVSALALSLSAKHHPQWL